MFAIENLLTAIVLILAVFDIRLTDQQCVLNNDTNSRPYNKLLRDLFCSYDSDAAPGKFSSSVVRIKIKFSPTYFIAVDELKAMQLLGFVNITWTDPILNWNPQNRSNITFVQGTDFDIWEPGLISREGSMLQYHYNETDTFVDRHIKINYNGKITFTSKIKLDGHCATNFEDWPFDRMRCSITAGVSTLNAQSILPKYDNMDLSGFSFEDRNWKVLNVSNRRKSFEECLRSTMRCPMNYVFILKRKSSVYESTFIFPQFCISILCLLAFRIFKGTVYRLALFIAILLSQIMYLVWLVSVLGVTEGQEESIRLFQFYAAISWIATFGVIQTLLNRYMLSERNQSLPPSFIIDIMDKIYENQYTQKLSSIYVTNKEEVIIEADQNAEDGGDDNLEEGKSDIGKQWKRLSGSCDTILFGVALCCIIYHFGFLLVNWF